METKKVAQIKTRFFKNLKTEAVWDIADGEQADYLAANTKDYLEVDEKAKLEFEKFLRDRDGVEDEVKDEVKDKAKK